MRTQLIIVALSGCWAVAVARAAPPGPLDGENIPADFGASKWVGLQTNRTGVGDVTSLETITTYSEGSELDALYLAKDSLYLYVGLTGNLEEDGHAFVIFIDDPTLPGQNALRAEGVGGSPHVVEAASRQVVINTQGTSTPSDDTWTYGAGGTVLPCNADYALVVDTFGGTMSVTEYALFDPAFGNVGTVDPTPGNPNDPLLNLYATQALMGQSPLNDLNEVLENQQNPDFSRAGFDNTNTNGVTDTSAASALAANTGMEIGIPLSHIGFGLSGNETINVFVLVMDGSGLTGAFSETAPIPNQALPSVSGSGFCNPPVSMAARPNLSTVTSCLSVNLNTVDFIDTGALLEGDVDPTDYEANQQTLTQNCPTSAGDRAREPDVLQPAQDGSELDGLFVNNDDEFVYLGLTGNLQAGGTSINLFIDADPEGATGEHVIDFESSPEVYTSTLITSFSNFNFSGRYERWTTATITSGPNNYRIQTTDFGGGFFDINPNLNAAGAIALTFDVTLNPAHVADVIRVILVDEDLTERVYRFDVAGTGPRSLSVPLSDFTNDNNVGSVPGLDVSNLSFFHITGGFNHGNPGVTFDVTFDNMALTGVLPGAAAIVTMDGNELPNGPLDELANGLFPSNAAVRYDWAYGINVGYLPHLAYVDFFDLVNNDFTFRGAVVPESGSSTLFDNPGGLVAENPNGLQMAFNNWNTDGVVGCEDAAPCFVEDAETVAQRAQGATTGAELAIPLADLGLDAGDLPRVIQLWTMVGSPLGLASDQSLPSMRNVTSGGNQVANPGNAPVNFTDPTAAAGASAVLSNFSSFALTGTYAQWVTATFTPGPSSFRVQSTDFGGGFFDMVPNVDASGATTLELDLTLHPANQTDKVVVVLTDDDGTERVYRFENLTNGTQTLSVDLSMYINDNNPGTTPGLNLSNLSFFHIAGAFHHGNPGVTMDVTFDNLALIGQPRNFEARAARVCLGTVAGDADCDGDNDLADVALLQQCVGVEADPVLPMECEQLDFLKDRQINRFDLPGFIGVLDGP